MFQRDNKYQKGGSQITFGWTIISQICNFLCGYLLKKICKICQSYMWTTPNRNTIIWKFIKNKRKYNLFIFSLVSKNFFNRFLKISDDFPDNLPGSQKVARHISEITQKISDFVFRFLDCYMVRLLKIVWKS